MSEAGYEMLVLWSLLRAVVVAGLAAVLGGWVLRYFGYARSALIRRAITAALVLIWLMPSLLTAYGWADFSLSLVRYPAWNELLYGWVLCLKLLPVAVLVMWLAPGAVLTDESRYCARLTPMARGFAGWRARSRWWAAALVYGRARGRLLAGVACGVLAFGEFEMAARLGVMSWTVWLFDAHAGGLTIGGSLRLAAWPVGVQMLGLVAGLWLLRPWKGAGGGTSDEAMVKRAGGSPPHWRGVAGAAAVVVSVLMVCVIPGWVAVSGAWGGAGAMLGRFALWSELFHSALFAIVGCAAAVGLGAVVVGGKLWRKRESGRWVIGVMLIGPGLLGALVLALLIQWIAGWLGGWVAIAQPTDTSWWLIAALMLLLMPLAMVVSLAMNREAIRERLFTARLLRGSRDRAVRARGMMLGWRMRGRGLFIGGAALFYIAYFELVASAILGPLDMPVASVRLHNLMHYGHSPVLSGMMVMMVGLPVVVAAVVWLLVRWAASMTLLKSKRMTARG